MLSKQVTKIVQNLEKKKFRDKYNLFKIEGDKLVGELLYSNIKIHTLIAYPVWIERNRISLTDIHVEEADEREMHTISNFQSPPEVIALAEIPDEKIDEAAIANSLSLVLNGIQDPGNLGTILRVADWFGIRQIFCDDDCAGVYNPKCVQASMGAIFRVQTIYTPLEPLLQKYSSETFPCYGTFLKGENIYREKLTNQGFIIMGNEGKGIRPEIEHFINHRLTIPSFATGKNRTESLNVAVATGIILSEFKRNSL
ncbi:MAG: RNA methyltransferase [Odoribacter sp.]